MILTERLALIPATVESIQTSLQGGDASLAALLSVQLPASWPPEFYDDETLRFTLNQLEQRTEQSDWGMHYFVLRTEEEPVLIGIGGYKGPPTPDGMVEIGYSIVSEYQCQGFATEATKALSQNAITTSPVKLSRIIAETLPELTASIRVMEKAGFQRSETSSDPAVIRYELLL